MNLMGVVLLKELREILRDRRTLVIMVGVPVLLYPALLIASEQLSLFGMRSLEAEPSRVAVVGDPLPGLGGFLADREGVRVVPVTTPETALRTDSVDAVAVVGDAPGEPEDEAAVPVTILFDGANERSQRGRAVLSEALREWREVLVAERLAERGLPATFVRPVLFSDSSIARPREIGGYALGRFLPLLLILITLLGAFYPAIDLAAGEKERGTLETLLTAPVPSGQIVAGKFLAVAIVGVVAAALNLASMLLTFQTGLFQFGAAVEVDFSIPLPAILLIFATLIPLAVLFGALFLGIAVRARSFKEAQNALTPVYMVMMVPALLPLFPGIEFKTALALVPVAGVSLLFRELMAGHLPALNGTLALLSTIVFAAGALAFAAASFGSESVLFGSGETGDDELRRVRGSRDRPKVPTPGQAGLFLAVLAALFFYVGITFQLRFGERGILVSEWLLLFLPVVVFLRVGRFDWRRTLSFETPRPLDVLGATLVIAGGLPAGWFIAWLQGFFLTIPVDLLERMAEFLVVGGPGRLAWLLLLVAVTPAVCEELVFRGVLLGSTRDRFPGARVILLNGVVFGAFHLSFETAFRFLPTAWLGILLATVAWRTRSIWTSVWMHFLNNGAIVLIAGIPFLRTALSGWDTGPPPVLLPPALALMALGFWILGRGRPGPEAAPARRGGGIGPIDETSTEIA